MRLSPLDWAITLAVSAHQGQVDKSGSPYILHPLRVMLAMDNDTDRIAAILHDVVEDCEDIDHSMIVAKFGEEIGDAVFALTRQEGETYVDFVARCGRNEIGRRVKIADLRDNLRPGAEHLAPRYRQALRILEEPLPHPDKDM